jgi:hypothetical protein
MSMSTIRYEFKAEPTRAWCCGVREGERCTATCPRLAVAMTIETEAIVIVAKRLDASESVVRDAATLWACTPKECVLFEAVRNEMDRLRDERGICEHYAPDRRACPECAGPEAHERVAAEAQRKANRDIGEEVARNSPPWAYPLGWRLAVMAEVERNNNRPTPIRASTNAALAMARMGFEAYLRAYHDHRLAGLTSKTALDRVLAAEGYDISHEWIPGLCMAYERGRPGPGGVSVTTPAR